MSSGYFTRQQLDRLKARHAEVGGDAFGHWRTQWTEIATNVRGHLDDGHSPADPVVQALARRWAALMADMTGNDPAIIAAMYAKMDGLGAEAATLDAVDTPTWEYVKRAFAVGFGR